MGKLLNLKKVEAVKNLTYVWDVSIAVHEEETAFGKFWIAEGSNSSAYARSKEKAVAFLLEKIAKNLKNTDT